MLYLIASHPPRSLGGIFIVNLTTSLFTIPEQISRQIKKAILQGDLLLGDRLPSEHKLAELFGVSRSTIRDALYLLKTERIIETRKGNQGGNFIAQKISPELIQNLNKYAFSSLNHLSLEHFFELSFIIEVPVAGLAAIHRSKEDIIHLKKLLNTLNDLCLSTHSSHSLLHSVISFHRVLASASHNPLIIEVIDYLHQLSVVLSFQFLLSHNQKRLLFETIHLIYSAIENQDVSKAERGMSEHLQLLGSITRVKEHDIIFGI